MGGLQEGENWLNSNQLCPGMPERNRQPQESAPDFRAACLPRSSTDTFPWPVAYLALAGCSPCQPWPARTWPQGAPRGPTIATLSRENPKAIRQYQQKSGKSPGHQVKEKFLRTVKRTATVLFLGLLTMLLLGALVYLGPPAGRRRETRFPAPRGWSCCEPGPGRPANPQSRLWLWRVTSASCPSGPAGRSLGPGWPFGTE